MGPLSVAVTKEVVAVQVLSLGRREHGEVGGREMDVLLDNFDAGPSLVAHGSPSTASANSPKESNDQVGAASP